MEKTALSAVRTMSPISTGSHGGTLPPAGTFLSVDAPAAVTSAVYAEEGKLIVRLYSYADEETDVAIDPKMGVKSAYTADLMLNKTGDAAVENGTVRAKIAAKSVLNVVMEL